MAKRFWSEAMVAEAHGGWHVLLDGKPMRLPSGAVLNLRHAALAAAVAAEWQAAGTAKGGDVSVHDMKLTGLAGAAQERIPPHRDSIVASLAAYAETDLLCYRAETPAGLAARQHACWQPWLDWAAARHGAPLLTTTAIVHIAQPKASLAALRDVLASCSNEALAACGLAIPALGSCVLGLALGVDAIDAQAVSSLSMLDELYQEEHWGSDPEAADRRRRLRADIALAARFMALARGERERSV